MAVVDIIIIIAFFFYFVRVARHLDRPAGIPPGKFADQIGAAYAQLQNGVLDGLLTILDRGI